MGEFQNSYLIFDRILFIHSKTFNSSVYMNKNQDSLHDLKCFLKKRHLKTTYNSAFIFIYMLVIKNIP